MKNINAQFTKDAFLTALTDYFRSGEKAPGDHSIGIELEHFVVYKDASGICRRVPFYGENGIESLLREVADSCFTRELIKEHILSEGHLIGFVTADYYITLEPGAQFEISMRPVLEVQEARDIYASFRRLFDPVLNHRGFELVYCSYSPDPSPEFPPLIPKKRYEIMDAWFSKIGPVGRQMMRNTCSTQVTFNYENEADFVRKYQTAVLLEEEMIELYDNPPVIPGADPFEYRCIRKKIWDQVDKDRCSLPPGVFEADFGYKAYAEYLWDIRPLLMEEMRDGEWQCIEIGSQTAGELWQTGMLMEKDIPSLLSMVFPPVRLRNYIEIRYADSLEPDRAFAYLEKMKSFIYGRNRNLWRK